MRHGPLPTRTVPLLTALIIFTTLTTTLATPLAPRASSAGSSSASKRGLAWPNQAWVPLTSFPSPNLSAYYTWTPVPVPSSSFRASTALPFVPMLWGCDADHIAAFQAALSTNFSGAALTADKAILAFNEPDLAVQSNCTPALAASVWQAYLELLEAKGYRLGSPAVTAGPWGKAWLMQPVMPHMIKCISLDLPLVLQFMLSRSLQIISRIA